APVEPFHSRTVPSPPAEASSLPSRLKHSSYTATPWPVWERTFSPVRAFHQVMPGSRPETTTDAPSGLTATARASWSRSEKVRRPLPVAVSPSFAERSLLADASHDPSGPKATA